LLVDWSQCLSELEAEHVECTVLGEGCAGGAKIELFVVSKKFDGVPLLKRHKMVNQLLSEDLSSNRIHALTIKAKTPAQYEATKK
jgi:stress-induced morphogen